MSDPHPHEWLESHLPAVSLRRHTPANTDTYSDGNSYSVHRQMYTDSATSSDPASAPITITGVEVLTASVGTTPVLTDGFSIFLE